MSGYGEKGKVITGQRIEIGDAIVGIPSNGVHSNGYSLVRRIIKDAGYSYHDPFPYNEDMTIGDELFDPTRIYMEILDAVPDFDIHGAGPYYGSGLMKLHRTTKYGFDINDPLEPQPIFKFLQEEGEVEDLKCIRHSIWAWALLW